MVNGTPVHLGERPQGAGRTILIGLPVVTVIVGLILASNASAINPESNARVGSVIVLVFLVFVLLIFLTGKNARLWDEKERAGRGTLRHSYSCELCGYRWSWYSHTPWVDPGDHGPDRPDLAALTAAYNDRLARERAARFTGPPIAGLGHDQR